jgi:diketogulonate reductase-like aldo/keto reductase
MPYDRDADIETQVRQSIESSLRRFDFSGTTGEEGESYIDCLVLHTRMPTIAETLQVWSILESYVPRRIHHLGISNTPLSHLAALFGSGTTVKPSVVQNRLVEEKGRYQSDVFAFCCANKVVFQSFWTLTANKHLVTADFTHRVAHGADVSNEVALYALVLGIQGWTVLNGTTREDRMVGDLKGVDQVERWAAGEGKDVWEKCLRELKGILDVE